MNQIIRNFMMAGIGGVITYYVVSFIVGTLVTGTTSADTFAKALIPILTAIGAAWLVITVSFRD